MADLIRIDEPTALRAVATAAAGLPFRAFLELATGEVLFLLDDDGDLDAWLVPPEVRQEYQSRRPRIEADPAAWLEIPKYPGGGGGERNFVLDWLAKNGIEAELHEELPF